MIQPIEVDFESILGDTVDFTVTLIQPKANETDPDVPVDLTGATAAAQCRETGDSTTVLADFTCTIPDPTTGEIDLVVPASVAAQMKAGRFPWDLQVTWPPIGDAEPVVETYIAGKWKVKQDVTRVGA